MSMSLRLSTGVVLSCLMATWAQGQAGGFGGGVVPQQTPATVNQPSSETAKMALAALDSRVEFGEVECEVGQLDEFLTTQLAGIPVFVDERAMKMAAVEGNTLITAKIPELPLRSALRRMLQPHGLRVVVEEEGLVVTADFTELTRRGLATDRWIDDSAADERIRAQTLEKISVDFDDTPLNEAVAEIAEQLDIPIVVDVRALEEIGLSDDTPVSLSLKNISCRSTLRLLLRELDLCYQIHDETLNITTIECAEQALLGRIYFLEGTGAPIGDFASMIQMIQTSVVPDTWEALGGPSTMVPLTQGIGNRPALLVSTMHDVHEQIEALLNSMRATHVGANPRAKVATQPNNAAGGGNAAMQGGGFF